MFLTSPYIDQAITLKIPSPAKDAQRLSWLADVRFHLTSEVSRIV